MCAFLPTNFNKRRLHCFSPSIDKKMFQKHLIKKIPQRVILGKKLKNANTVKKYVMNVKKSCNTKETLNFHMNSMHKN